MRVFPLRGSGLQGRARCKTDVVAFLDFDFISVSVAVTREW